ncbi:uncharacterized protein MKK02DRAFT_31752 [Dioszegia hungarica]|uniref:BZIP domain-containing protein n=1 Tax=Dioszegia hungarica TaxID=4972 RepID=A0AA38LWH1_9TREE|nr:uncharacterized protein MKK02DRAFT_31752 [Dioszegia hungarica]KAI9638295.1 hypothetical protein MKK02DRAFT_31752 [Dioszegia hungarica]
MSANASRFELGPLDLWDGGLQGLFDPLSFSQPRETYPATQVTESINGPNTNQSLAILPQWATTSSWNPTRSQEATVPLPETTSATTPAARPRRRRPSRRVIKACADSNDEEDPKARERREANAESQRGTRRRARDRLANALQRALVAESRVAELERTCTQLQTRVQRYAAMLRANDLRADPRDLEEGIGEGTLTSGTGGAQGFGVLLHEVKHSFATRWRKQPAQLLCQPRTGQQRCFKVRHGKRGSACQRRNRPPHQCASHWYIVISQARCLRLRVSLFSLRLPNSHSLPSEMATLEEQLLALLPGHDTIEAVFGSNTQQDDGNERAGDEPDSVHPSDLPFDWFAGIDALNAANTLASRTTASGSGSTEMHGTVNEGNERQEARSGGGKSTPRRSGGVRRGTCGSCGASRQVSKPLSEHPSAKRARLWRAGVRLRKLRGDETTQTETEMPTASEREAELFSLWQAAAEHAESLSLQLQLLKEHNATMMGKLSALEKQIDRQGTGFGSTSRQERPLATPVSVERDGSDGTYVSMDGLSLEDTGMTTGAWGAGSESLSRRRVTPALILQSGGHCVDSPW